MRFLSTVIHFQALLAVSHAVYEVNGTYTGDILLGGLFPIHNADQNGNCNTSRLELDGFFYLEAFYYSLDLLNNDLMKCCGFKLGAVTLDTCMSDRKGLSQVSTL